MASGFPCLNPSRGLKGDSTYANLRVQSAVFVCVYLEALAFSRQVAGCDLGGGGGTEGNRVCLEAKGGCGQRPEGGGWADISENLPCSRIAGWPPACPWCLLLTSSWRDGLS